ncbi:hypothetical protein RND81_09G162500 [Saponaria officinalis]|uniref:Filament-like plant protein 7 n=1 Tax=Saponaria officinalis TaxID=3572 RepID=A0AAW1IN92_SAPOF
MEHKPWRWRRKHVSHKTINANGGDRFDEERDNDAESLKYSSNLSDRRNSDICDCSAKEELIRKHRRIAEQALAGQEMERAEAAYMKEELDKAVQQGELAEKKLAQLNAALKDCMREIESLKEQQDERVEKAVLIANADCEKERAKLEAKLTEANRRISNLSSENANLMKALICKERHVQDLNKGKDELESEVGVLTGRLETVEKEKAFLKYEFRVMEKELEVWNEERKVERRSAVERAKQISQLETECLHLRDLVKRRLQIDVQGADKGSIPKASEKSAESMSCLIERVYTLEDENTTLREIMALSDRELQSWRVKYGQMGCKMAELEAQIQELTGSDNSMQLTLSGKYDGIDDSETWASALIAELEQFKQGKLEDRQEYKAIVVGGKDDDDVEMQKFAIVSADNTELVPVCADHTADFRHHKSWLDEILEVILEEHRVSKRDLSDLLEDIRIALGQNGNCKSKAKVEKCSEIHGLLTWEGSETGQGEDDSFAREKIRKYFGFDRSKSDIGMELHSSSRHNTLAQMVAIQSNLQDENRRLKEKIQSVTKELTESKEKIESLQNERETFEESKVLIEDQIENQRLINEDLSTQLTVAKSKLNEILHKLSSLEVELDHRNHCCDELEATCLELQLQLETVSRKQSPNTYLEAVAKQLFDQALCPVTAITVHDKKSPKVQGSSLRDHLLVTEYDEKASNRNAEKSIVAYTGYKPLPPPEPKPSSPEQVATLAVVPSKTTGAFGFFRKLFLRRKKECAKMKAIQLQRNTSTALMKQRDVLLLV